MLRSARGWLASDTDRLGGWWWAWSKWACIGAAQQLALYGGHGRRAAAAGKITAVSTVGVDWGHCTYYSKTEQKK